MHLPKFLDFLTVILLKLIKGYELWGMGHGAWGMGHGAWGMEAGGAGGAGEVGEMEAGGAGGAGEVGEEELLIMGAMRFCEVGKQGRQGRQGRQGERNKLSIFWNILVLKKLSFSLYSPCSPCSLDDDLTFSRCSH